MEQNSCSPGAWKTNDALVFAWNVRLAWKASYSAYYLLKRKDGMELTEVIRDK